MPFRRDPLSVLFDDGARQLLARAYAAPGQWAGTRLADPSPRHLAYAARLDINPLARDGLPGGAARTRWVRAFVRALYYQHKWYGGPGGLRASRRTTANPSKAIEVDVGRRVLALGVIPAGHAIRVRVLPGGQKALAAVQREGDGERIFDDEGDPSGGRWADPARRDWA